LKSVARFPFSIFGARRLPTTSVLVVLLAATGAFAQVPASSPTQAPDVNSSDQAQPTASAPGVTSPEDSAAKSERTRFAVNPVTGLVTTPGAGYKPLTGKERWKLYWKQNYFSVGAYFGPTVTALLDQATNSPYEWGGGIPGYGRRFASRTADAILQRTFQAPVAAILHEDVRYISSPEPGGKRRFLHAIAYSFLTYNSDGHPTLNLANLGGYYASTAISTTWLPGQHSVAAYTFTNGTEQIGLGIVVNLLQEFWSEATHTVLRRP
jgi:hypothetical protein